MRSADDILDEVLRKRRRDERPEPAHKLVWAEMSRDLDGEPTSAKDAVFGALLAELNLRNAREDRPEAETVHSTVHSDPCLLA